MLRKEDKRRGVLEALRAELKVHADWVGTPYPDGVVRAEWGSAKGRMTFRLVTGAIDHAITQAHLFRGPELIAALIEYRQAVGNLNQSIDALSAFQAQAALWSFGSRRLARRSRELTRRLHWDRIGTADSEGAHARFIALRDALDQESDSA